MKFLSLMDVLLQRLQDLLVLLLGEYQPGVIDLRCLGGSATSFALLLVELTKQCLVVTADTDIRTVYCSEWNS